MKHEDVKSAGITVCLTCGQIKTKARDKSCNPK